jgi:PIN domain nuclease of toxin-antitoxin system
MSYLLDTHAIIWALLEPKSLSRKARKVIENPSNLIFVSSINFWEISLKFSIGKLALQGINPDDFPNIAVESGFEIISLLPEEAATYHNLKGDWHRDPFDRMLIWQAIKQNLVLITKDEAMKNYKKDGLKTLW